MANGGPHVLEGFRWHVRMAHDVMRLAHQLVIVKTTGVDKALVAVGDVAAQIGCGYQNRIVGQLMLALSNRKVNFHGCELFETNGHGGILMVCIEPSGGW